MILRGSATGLSARGSHAWSQATRGVRGTPVFGDGFGRALAVGRFAGNSYDDLAIGSPSLDADDDLHRYDGAVNILYGSPDGLTVTGNQLWDQTSAGIPGTPGVGDQFGAALVAGSFRNGPGSLEIDDLAIGVPGETDGRRQRAAVYIPSGASLGLTSAGWSR